MGNSETLQPNGNSWKGLSPLSKAVCVGAFPAFLARAVGRRALGGRTRPAQQEQPIQETPPIPIELEDFLGQPDVGLQVSGENRETKISDKTTVSPLEVQPQPTHQEEAITSPPTENEERKPRGENNSTPVPAFRGKDEPVLQAAEDGLRDIPDEPVERPSFLKETTGRIREDWKELISKIRSDARALWGRVRSRFESAIESLSKLFKRGAEKQPPAKKASILPRIRAAVGQYLISRLRLSELIKARGQPFTDSVSEFTKSSLCRPLVAGYIGAAAGGLAVLSGTAFLPAFLAGCGIGVAAITGVGLVRAGIAIRKGISTLRQQSGPKRSFRETIKQTRGMLSGAIGRVAEKTWFKVDHSEITGKRDKLLMGFSRVVYTSVGFGIGGGIAIATQLTKPVWSILKIFVPVTEAAIIMLPSKAVRAGVHTSEWIWKKLNGKDTQLNRMRAGANAFATGCFAAAVISLTGADESLRDGKLNRFVREIGTRPISPTPIVPSRSPDFDKAAFPVVEESVEDTPLITDDPTIEPENLYIARVENPTPVPEEKVFIPRVENPPVVEHKVFLPNVTKESLHTVPEPLPRSPNPQLGGVWGLTEDMARVEGVELSDGTLNEMKNWLKTIFTKENYPYYNEGPTVHPGQTIPQMLGKLYEDNPAAQQAVLDELYRKIENPTTQLTPIEDLLKALVVNP